MRDAVAHYQVVLQTDHADLSGQLARQWAEPVSGSLVLAAERHDDGWAVWEQAPTIDSELGKPLNFLDVGVLSHLAFYRACIAAVTEQDEYGGLLISMHGAGIYRERYGGQPGLKLTFQDEVQRQVDAFVAEQEGSWPERIAALGVSDEQRWADYHLLQAYDRLSLYFCLEDTVVGEGDEIGDYLLEPLAPWRVRMRPFPFRQSPARFTLLRRLVPKRRFGSQAEFREEFLALEPERTEIVFER